jgi:hypothetical protein
MTGPGRFKVGKFMRNDAYIRGYTEGCRMVLRQVPVPANPYETSETPELAPYWEQGRVAGAEDVTTALRMKKMDVMKRLWRMLDDAEA